MYTLLPFKGIDIMPSRIITTRIDKKTEDLLKNLTEIFHTDKSSLLRNALNIGLQNLLKENTIKKFKKNKISLEKMAEELDISVLEAIEFLSEEGLYLHYDIEELQEDLKVLKNKPACFTKKA